MIELGGGWARKREQVFKGHVLPGRGQAAIHINHFMPEIQAITGEEIFPGSLNIVLDRPVRFSCSAAASFDNNFRMLWPASLNDVPVWIYRWQHTALHVVEVIAPVQLRSLLQLDNGSAVKLRVVTDAVGTVSLTGYATWAILWAGRKNWPYTNTGYYMRSSGIAQKLGATQRIPQKKVSIIVIKQLKSFLRGIPIFGAAAAKLRGRSRGKMMKSFTYSRLPTDGLTDRALLIGQVRNLLAYTKTSNSAYNAQEFPAGYHSISINGEELRGQREPRVRIDLAPVDFKGKSVLDIGCNQGGMLFQIRDEVRWGVGIDFDPRMVNAANRIKSALGDERLSFYVFDLEREPLELIQDLLPDGKADVCFLLSVCMWIANWRQVIDFASRHSGSMLFETNGSDQQQEEQVAYLHQKYRSVLKLSNESVDDPGQKKRQLYFLDDII